MAHIVHKNIERELSLGIALGRGSLNLSTVQYVVLDEADEMLDMGFVDDIEAILDEKLSQS